MSTDACTKVSTNSRKSSASHPTTWTTLKFSTSCPECRRSESSSSTASSRSTGWGPGPAALRPPTAHLKAQWRERKRHRGLPIPAFVKSDPKNVSNKKLFIYFWLNLAKIYIANKKTKFFFCLKCNKYWEKKIYKRDFVFRSFSTLSKVRTKWSAFSLLKVNGGLNFITLE